MSECSAPAGFQPLTTGSAFLARAGRLFMRQNADGTRDIGTRIELAQANSERFAHGGFLLTFVDVALSVVTHGEMISLSNDFLRPGRCGSWIVAQVQIEKASRTLIFAGAKVVADDILLMRARGLYRPHSPER